MDRDRVIAEVARRNGVLLAPNDPIMQIHTMLDLHSSDHQERGAKLADLPGEIDQRIAPLLAEVRAARVAIEKANDKPVITDHQVKWTVVPALLAAWNVWQVLLLVVALGLGFGAHWWLTPMLNCGATLQNRPICYRFDGPPLAEAPVAPAPQTPAKAQR